MSSNEAAIGIDLGTTNSCVAILKDGVAEVIPNDFGERTTPSMVTICDDGTRYIGKQAKNLQFKNLKNTIYESKRLIGRKYSEQSVQDRMLHWHFKVVNSNGNPKIRIPQSNKIKKYFFPEEISGMILGKMKDIAEKHLGHSVTKAVVTVPAYFNDNQRQATIDAAKIAGLDILKIMNEPTAAAFAYILKNGIDKACNTFVFDLGGGTFDVSIINNNGNNFTVIAVNGDPDLGGADFDILLYNKVMNIIQKQANERVSFKDHQIRRIMANCIKVKEQLSTAASAEFDLPNIVPDLDFEHTFTKEDFEKLIKHLIRKIMVIVRSILSDAKMSIQDIDNVVLVGGSSKIPAICKSLHEFFKKELSFGVNPDEAVACGAAYQAAILMDNEDVVIRNVAVVDVTPLSLGIEAERIKMDVLIKKNTPLPASFTKIYTTVMDNQTALRISVYQGEDALTQNNTNLGYFDLMGIPLAPARVPLIQVTFYINTNGVLHVTATETSSHETTNMTIVTNTGRISQTDFVRIRKDNDEYSRKQRLVEQVSDVKNDTLKFCFEAKRRVKSMSTISDDSKYNFISSMDNAINYLENLSISESALQDLHKKKVKLQNEYENVIAPT